MNFATYPLVIFLTLVLFPASLFSSPFTADTVVGGPATAASANENPAQAARLKQNEFSSIISYRTSNVKIRFPNFPTISKTQNSIDPKVLLSGINTVRKYSSWHISFTPIPPLVLPKNMTKVAEIPIVILDQPENVDVKTVVKVNYGLFLTAAYSLTDNFALGMRFETLSVNADADVYPSGNNVKLLNAKFKFDETDIRSGLFWQMNQWLALGFAVNLFRIGGLQATEINTQFSAIGQESQNDGQEQTPPSPGTFPLSEMVLGFGINLSKHFSWLIDFDYSRADPSAQAFSLVDRRNKEKEVYDTLAVGTGIIAKVRDNMQLMAGYRRQPASVGEGSKDSPNANDSQSGFGPIDLIPILVGLDDLKPYDRYTFGVLGKFKPIHKKDDDHPSYYKFHYGMGMIYQYSSLGIGDKGEQPGAYLHKKIGFPIHFSYVF